MYGSQTAGDSGQPGTVTGGRGAEQTADTTPVMVHGERTEGTAYNTGPPEHTAGEERVHPQTSSDTAHGATHEARPPRASETEDLLALIFASPHQRPAKGQR